MAARANLPVIDYKLLTARNADGSRTADGLAERKRFFLALSEHGFTYLKNPGVSQAEVNQLFQNSKTFFAKPLDLKKTILGRMDKGRGPSQGYSNPALLAADPTTSDIKEFFGLYRDDDVEKPNQWLEDDDSKRMRTDLVHLFNSGHQVILDMLSAVSEEAGLATDALHEAVNEKNHFIANLHYPATPSNSFQNRVRAAAHTDYGCLTLLFNDSGEGLQVLRNNGAYEYIPRRDDCAIVNVGDLLSRFFNGKLPSTMHRVVEPATTDKSTDAVIPSRYSIAFFGHFNLQQLVKPFEEFCTAEHPAAFEPVLAGEHVKARVRQLHVAGHSLKGDKAHPPQDRVPTQTSIAVS